jgi:hypothetical protein
MVNSSTNINKTNNHLSPQITEHKKTTRYDNRNVCPGLGQTNIWRLKPLNWILYLPLLIIRTSNSNTDWNDENNPAHIRFLSKGPHTITNMNDNRTWTVPKQGQWMLVVNRLPVRICWLKTNTLGTRNHN